MAVTKEELAQYVAELGLPQEQTDTLVTTLMANEKAATQFVGQRLRHSDYTRKTQELATQRQDLESQANQQITAYATQLAEAQNKISIIMNDLETEQISSAKANARLRSVKEKYNLSDQDIPAVEGVAKPAGTATANPQAQTVDIDKKLQDFGKNLLNTLRQDMLAMPKITAIQADIMDEHRDLTGKRLSRAEMNELLVDAEKNKVSLEQAWKDKHKIDDLRLEKRDGENKKKWQAEWEAERKAKISEEAISGVRNRVDQSQPAVQSPVIGRKFNEFRDPGQHQTQTQTQAQPQQTGPKLSGAERAAAKFLERRANGIPMGTAEVSK